MTRISRPLFLTGVAVLALAACSSSKGPGEIGKKEDIVVRNKGIPGAVQEPVIEQSGDFTSTIEQAEAVPAPAVAEPEPLPDTSPAVEAAVEAHEQAQAPLPSQTAVPSTADVADANPMDSVAPMEPVTQAAVPPPANPAHVPSPEIVATPASAPEAVSAPVSADASSSSIYPASDYPQSAVAPAPAPTPVPAQAVAAAPEAVYTPAPASVSGEAYPLDPNAPYSPKAIAAAAAAAGTPPVAPQLTPTGINLNDPALIRSAQAALAAKSLYVGPQTGIVDASLLNALAQYQSTNGLQLGGLNEETLKHLGIIE